MYVVKQGDFYVARPGSQSSYTPDIRRARKFASRELALKEKCGNEYIVTVMSEVCGNGY